MIRIAIPLIALGLLAGCGKTPEAPAPDNDAQNAEGDVLEGSISDAMLPVDTLQSQSPPAKIESAPADKAEGAGPSTSGRNSTPKPAASPSEAGNESSEESAAESTETEEAE